jgi:hypothetical protein
MAKEQVEREYLRRLADEGHRVASGQIEVVRRLAGVVASLKADRGHLEERVQQLQEELLRRDRERAELGEQLAQIAAENERLAQEYADVQRKSGELASLYVAAFRLHQTLDRKEVLTAIEEVVQSLIGCEEVIVFERCGEVLRPLAAFGIDPSPWCRVPLGQGVIGAAAARREAWINPEPADEAGEGAITACIPLLLDGQLSGAIVLFRLLGHKLGLEPVDHELFDLLSSHAAMALYTTALHARAQVSA